MSSGTVEIAIPALLPHQQPVAQHPARFKLVRKGRRWGKDRIAFNVSWFGHGPDHQWAGIVDGWDVAWLAPDYPQARILWQEEIEPRFRGMAGVEVNETEHSVIVPGYGGLFLFSAENVTAIRGLGKRLIGVVINEAAHMDLAYAWRYVIRPPLMDHHGWALIMSTTNSGNDGGKDDQGQPRIPSFFNTLCEEVRAGTREEEWAEFEGDATQNPKIDPAEFQSLVREYPQDSVALQEEVYARLLPPGKGLAFPEWRADLHTLDGFTVPTHWRVGAGYDWGYYQPAAFCLTVQDEDGACVVVGEQKWTTRLAFDMGKEIAAQCLSLKLRPEYIACDSSMWGVQGQKGWANLAEELQAGINAGWPGHEGPGLLAVPKGADSRIARAQLLHRYLKWETDEAGTVMLRPRLRILKRCSYLIASLPRLSPDPKKREDVDTTGDDHGYDALTYYLMTRPQPALPAPRPRADENTHPGVDWERGQRKIRAIFDRPVPVGGHFPGSAGVPVDMGGL